MDDNSIQFHGEFANEDGKSPEGMTLEEFMQNYIAHNRAAVSEILYRQFKRDIRSLKRVHLNIDALDPQSVADLTHRFENEGYKVSAEDSGLCSTHYMTVSR